MSCGNTLFNNSCKAKGVIFGWWDKSAVISVYLPPITPQQKLQIGTRALQPTHFKQKNYYVHTWQHSDSLSPTERHSQETRGGRCWLLPETKVQLCNAPPHCDTFLHTLRCSTKSRMGKIKEYRYLLLLRRLSAIAGTTHFASSVLTSMDLRQQFVWLPRVKNCTEYLSRNTKTRTSLIHKHSHVAACTSPNMLSNLNVTIYSNTNRTLMIDSCVYSKKKRGFLAGKSRDGASLAKPSTASALSNIESHQFA